MINVLSCSFRSRPACNWSVEKLQPAFSARSDLLSERKGAHNVVAYHVPDRVLIFSALPASDVSTAVGEDLL